MRDGLGVTASGRAELRPAPRGPKQWTGHARRPGFAITEGCVARREPKETVVIFILSRQASKATGPGYGRRGHALSREWGRSGRMLPVSCRQRVARVVDISAPGRLCTQRRETTAPFMVRHERSGRASTPTPRVQGWAPWRRPGPRHRRYPRERGNAIHFRFHLARGSKHEADAAVEAAEGLRSAGSGTGWRGHHRYDHVERTQFGVEPSGRQFG